MGWICAGTFAYTLINTVSEAAETEVVANAASYRVLHPSAHSSVIDC